MDLHTLIKKKARDRESISASEQSVERSCASERDGSQRHRYSHTGESDMSRSCEEYSVDTIRVRPRIRPVDAPKQALAPSRTLLRSPTLERKDSSSSLREDKERSKERPKNRSHDHPQEHPKEASTERNKPVLTRTNSALLMDIASDITEHSKQISKEPAPAPQKRKTKNTAKSTISAIAGIIGTHSAQPATAQVSQLYSDEEIRGLLSGYIQVPKSLWEYIPNKSHIRYYRKGEAHNRTDANRNNNFKLGGFVRCQTSVKNTTAFTLETIPGSCISCGSSPEYTTRGNIVTYSIQYNEIDEIWKKYDQSAFIELHMIYNSISRQNKRIEELEAKIKALTTPS